MNSVTELLFLGMPETGKTTYFVALDEVLQTEQHGLVSNGFAAKTTYLESAKVLWRAGKRIDRTSVKPNDEPVELLVRHSESSSVAHLVAPDVFGEFYDDQWAERRWPISFRERLAKLAGVLLFINAGKSSKNSEMTAFWRNLPSNDATAKPWDPRGAAEQVKLVDLLQAIVERGKVRKPLPIAVMISAWDLIESPESLKTTPGEFLKNEWALLNQFLSTNYEQFLFHVFGVSARGGDDAAQNNLIRLQPQDRVWLKDEHEVTKDLTRPIRWLLGW